MPSRQPVLRGTAAALLAVFAACSESGPVTPAIDPAAQPPAGTVALTCTATVAAGSIECRLARPAGARGDLYLGGQGVRVRLTSTSGVYDAPTQTLRSDVTVQNLLSQAIGTPDGTTKTGVRVFFHSGPTVTGGSGTVTVQNPDGSGTFTASNQPYFLYDQILQPRGTSSAKTWRFTVPSTATTFVFSVYVAAEAPVEDGLLRWNDERGGPGEGMALWGASDSSVFMVGQSGAAGSGSQVAHWDGHSWINLLSTTRDDDAFNDVSGSSSRDVWVATGNGSLLHYDGNAWTRYSVGGSAIKGVWVAAPGDAFAVGANGTLLRWNGSAWSPMTSPLTPFSPPTLDAVWGSSASDVFAVGDAGTIVRWNGTAWAQMTSNTTADLRAVWGSSPTDVWAVSRTGTLHHYDGVSWDETTSEVPFLWDVWGSSASDVYAVGADASNDAALLHWDGSTWNRVAPSPTGGLNTVWGTPGGRFFAVGQGGVWLTKAPAGSWQVPPSGGGIEVAVGTASDVLVVGTSVLHWNGAAWNTVLGPGSQIYLGAWYDGTGTFYVVGTNGSLLKVANGAVQSYASIASVPLRGVWGTGPSDVFAVGDGGTIVRSTGGAFSPMTSGTTQNLQSVWGSGSSNVIAVGSNGTIRRFNGTSWSAMTSGTTAPLYAVDGTSPSNVWAVGGSGTVLHYDGTTWTKVPSPVTTELQAVSVAPDGVVHVGGQQVLMRYANGQWQRYTSLTSTYSGIDGLSGNDLYAVGSGVILHGIR